MQDQDKPLTTSEAVRLIQEISGKRVHPSSIWRWQTRGIRGVVLGATCIGATLHTTRRELEKFFGELNQARLNNLEAKTKGLPKPKPKGRSCKRRQREIEAAKAVLREAGI